MSRPRLKDVALAVLGIGAVATLGHVVKPQDTQNRASSVAERAAQAQQKADTHNAAVAAFGEELVRAGLKDPASAQFEDVFGRTKHGLAVACGRVNARNSFGAYEGSPFFVVEELTGAVIVQLLQIDVRFQRAWKRDCTGRGDEAPAPPTGLFAIHWGERPPAELKPYTSARQVWVFRRPPPARSLGVPISSAFYEADKGRIFGGDVVGKGQNAYDQLKAALTTAYGEPTTEISSNGFTAWDWGKGSGLVQLSWSPAIKEADVHLKRRNAE